MSSVKQLARTILNFDSNQAGGIRNMRRPKADSLLLLLSLVAVTASGTLWLFQKSRTGPGELIPLEPVMEWNGLKESAPNPSRVKAAYVLENKGGKPVKILKTATSCGCLESSVSPSVVAAGKQARVEVEAVAFPVGERSVTLTLWTDSPVTPVVTLTFRMIGGRRPPFLGAVSGDLTYLGDPGSEKREFIAVTVEERGVKENPPVVKSNLEFLKFQLTKFEEKPYTTDTTVQRTYTFQVTADNPPADTFDGEVLVEDPWDHVSVQKIRVLCQRRQAVRFAPSRITLNPGEPKSFREGEVFHVIIRDESIDPVIGPEQETDNPLVIEEVPHQSSSANRLKSYSVKLKPGVRCAPGVYNLVLRDRQDGHEKFILPVAVGAQ